MRIGKGSQVLANSNWDVFHAERLEAERGLTTLQVLNALARGDLKDDDLIRPAGSSVPWVAVADCLEIHQPPSSIPEPEPESESEVKLPARPQDPGSAYPTPSTNDPKLGASGETGTGTSFDEFSNEFAFQSETNEFEEPESDSEDTQVGETRFFQGMDEDEFEILDDPESPVDDFRSKGPAFELGPNEDESEHFGQGFPRADGKVAEDDLGLDLDLDPRRIDPRPKPKEPPRQELKTWDDGEPDSIIEIQAFDDEPAPAAPENADPHGHSDRVGSVDDVEEKEKEAEDDDDGSDEFASVEMEFLDDDEAFDEPESPQYDEEDEAEAAAEFTLVRSGPETVEELDLAAMVDVAFQLVLFFLVTATTVLYKSLEVPKPNPETSQAASATQGKSLDELKDAFILVEIDSAGSLKIDQEPIAAEPDLIVKRLRAAREGTDRQSMLLSADFSTPHRSAVLAYDAANEIGLGIAIARPQPKP